MGLPSEAAHAVSGATNVAAAGAWAGTVAVCIPIALFTPADVFFTPLLGIPLSGGLYAALSLATARRRRLRRRETVAEPSPARSPVSEKRVEMKGGDAWGSTSEVGIMSA